MRSPSGADVALVSGQEGRDAARTTAALVTLLGAVLRAVLAMLVPAVRTPGWPDIVLAVVAAVAATFIFTSGPVSTSRRWGALTAGLFWLVPFLSGVLHGQSASPATAAMAAVAVTLIAAPPHTSVLLRAAVASGGLVVLVSVLYGGLSGIGILDGGFHILPEYERSIGGVPALRGIATHPNILGPIAALTVLLSLPIAWGQRRVGPWLIPGLATVGLLWTQSRSAILGAALALLAWFLVGRWPQIRGYLLGMATLVMIAPAFVAISVWRDYLPIDGLFTGRLLAWSIGLMAFGVHPIFGFGPDVFSGPFWNEHPGLYWQPLHAHNQLIELAAQAGLVGVTSLLGLMLVAALAVLARVGVPARMAAAAVVLTAILCAVEVPLGLTYFPISYFFPTLLMVVMSFSAGGGERSLADAM